MIKPPRKHKEARRRNFPAQSCVFSRATCPEHFDRAAAAIAAQCNIEVAKKYYWEYAFFTDGSVQEAQGGKSSDAAHTNRNTGPQLVGAAVYRAKSPHPEDESWFTGRSELHIRINPNGHGVNNTINRAELAAIYHALADYCRPDEPATIFTDSQVSIQLISKMIYRPETLTGRDVCIHLDLLKRIAQCILQRAAAGTATRILKVKSHTGIQGNDKADALAKEAAQQPETAHKATPASAPFADKWWPATQAPPKDGAPPDSAPEYRAVSNLRTALKEAVRPATRQGYSNTESIYSKAWAETYQPEGARPDTSNAMWTSKRVPHAALALTLKARYGLLWNMKLARRYRRPYLQTKHTTLPFSQTDACPLCRQPDSCGHILGGCQHRAMKGLYITRHDEAVRKTVKAIRAGSLGGSFCIMDAGTMDGVLNVAAHGKRIPNFLLPDIDPDTLKRMRPDILLIEGLPAAATRRDIQTALRNQRNYTIHIVEVGYGPDTRIQDTLTRKQKQHERLKAALSEAQWKVEEHIIVLGHAATTYKSTASALKALGLTHDQATRLMASLHIHATLLLRTIVQARRRLERTTLGSSQTAAACPPRGGVG